MIKFILTKLRNLFRKQDRKQGERAVCHRCATRHQFYALIYTVRGWHTCSKCHSRFFVISTPQEETK